MHHRRLVGSESRKLFAVAQRVDDLAAHAGLARGRGVRVPDVLAIQLSRRDQHGELLDLFRQRGFVAQVVVQEGGPLVRFRHMDQDRAWAVAGNSSKPFHHLVEDRPLAFGNALSRRHR